MMRQLGGTFGVTILGAAFSAAGSYASAGDFAVGFRATFAVGAGMALLRWSIADGPKSRQ